MKSYIRKKEESRKAIFMPETLHEKIKEIADKNNRTLIGQLKEWTESK